MSPDTQELFSYKTLGWEYGVSSTQECVTPPFFILLSLFSFHWVGGKIWNENFFSEVHYFRLHYLEDCILTTPLWSTWNRLDRWGKCGLAILVENVVRKIAIQSALFGFTSFNTLFTNTKGIQLMQNPSSESEHHKNHTMAARLHKMSGKQFALMSVTHETIMRVYYRNPDLPLSKLNSLEKLCMNAADIWTNSDERCFFYLFATSSCLLRLLDPPAKPTVLFPTSATWSSHPWWKEQWHFPPALNNTMQLCCPYNCQHLLCKQMWL